MDLGADHQRRRDSAQLPGTRPSVAVDAGAPASETTRSRTQLTPPTRDHRESQSVSTGVSGAQVDDKRGSWNHHHHHQPPQHNFSDQARVSPYDLDARPYMSGGRAELLQQTQQITALPCEGLDRLDIRNSDLRTSHLARYADHMPASQDMGRRYPVAELASPAADIPESAFARNARVATERRGAGQDQQGMSASRIQIRQSPDASSPSIPAHPANHFPESYRPQSITKTPHVRSTHTPRTGHELVQDERPSDRQPPPQRAEHPPHRSPLFIHTGQRGHEQDYRRNDRRSAEVSPMDYDYRRTQSSLSPQSLIPPLQSLFRGPSDSAGMDNGNRMKVMGRQYSPTPSGHYKLDSRGSSQLRHHPYRHSPPPPIRRHSESLSPQGQWTHSPREHQHPQQEKQQQHHQQTHRNYQQQQQQQQQQTQQQQTQLHQAQLFSDQTSSREQLVSQNRRRVELELGRQQQQKGYGGEETRPLKYEQGHNISTTISGTSNDRGQPRLNPHIQPPGATNSSASLGQVQEEHPPQSRPSVNMTPALSFSNISIPSTSHVDQRTLTPQHQYHALRLSYQQHQDRPSVTPTSVASRGPLSPHEGAPMPLSRADYDRQGPKSEARISAAPQHGERWVAFVDQSVDEATRPAMVARGLSHEARWEPTPRTLGSSASNPGPPEGDESPDPALPRRYSAADALELGSQDRRGTGLFTQGRLQDTRSNSLVATSGEVCSAHYDARPIRAEQQEWPNRDLRDASEYFGRRQQQQHTMFVDVGGQDTNLGSSGRAGDQLSSTLASPTGSSSRRDMYSVVSGPAENDRSVQKRESMEIEIPPGSIAVAAAAAEAITGIGTADYRSDHMDLESPPSPVLRSELGEPGYYSEKDLRKLYWVWRTREEEEKRLSQQSQQSDRDDVSMEGADEGDAHDSGGTNDAWTKSQRENCHLRDGPGLRHSSQEGEDGGGIPNKGKSRKVEKAGRYEDDAARRERGCKGNEPKEWHVEDEENEDEDDEEEEGEGDDDEEEGDDGSYESEDGDDGGFEDGSTGKAGAEGSEDGKNAVARRTRTQTGRKDQPRGHSEISSGATSRAGAWGSSDDLRRTRARDDKKHGCDECQKRFSRPSQLRTHQLTHSGEKPHQCHLCDKHFNVASNLKRHIRTHDKLPRKNSRDGSGVFRGFTQGFQAKQNASLKGSSMEASRKARSSKSSHVSSVVTSKRPVGSIQPLERLRWMSTETPESSKMAASKQAKIAAVKQRTTEQGASSSKSRSTISPSEAPAAAHAQPAAAASTPSVAASIVHSSPGTDSIAARDYPPQPLPPPTPGPSRESDSESTLVDGTQA